MIALLPIVACALSYWRDPRIHNFGNVGVRGALHAALAPLSTRIIDHVAYNGSDVRAELLEAHVAPNDAVVDFCCGVGFSTRARATGVDTSDQMLAVARARRSDALFVSGNAETWGDDDAYDVATCFFAMHEMPRGARRRVLRNMLRVARTALVVDISPQYVPSRLMLSGEPYLIDYQRDMDDDFVGVCAPEAAYIRFERVVPGHVTLWEARR